MIALPGASREAVVQGFPTGLAGTVGFQVIDNVGGVTIARTTTGIVERPASSGIYTITFTTPANGGDYTIVWDKGSMSPSNVATEELVVTLTALTPGAGNPLYVTRVTLKATLTLTGQTYADLDIDTALNAACRGIDQACGRRFYPDADATHVRYFTPKNHLTFPIGDLIALTTFQTDIAGTGSFSTAWTLNTDFILEPMNAAEEGFGQPYNRIRVLPRMTALRLYGWPREAKVTGQWGWAAVPDPVTQATTIIATRLLKRAREAPFGVVSLGFEGEAARIARNDPDVAFLLGPYMSSVLIA